MTCVRFAEGVPVNNERLTEKLGIALQKRLVWLQLPGEENDLTTLYSSLGVNKYNKDTYNEDNVLKLKE